MKQLGREMMPTALTLWGQTRPMAIGCWSVTDQEVATLIMNQYYEKTWFPSVVTTVVTDWVNWVTECNWLANTKQIIV